MVTECNQQSFRFHALGRRDVVARFDGGRITSDGGGVLLREVERVTGIIRRFAGCFTDDRDADRIEHTVDELIAQRIYALALGYEDLNDHDDLRHDSAEVAEDRCTNPRDRPQSLGILGGELPVSRSLPASVRPSCATEPDPFALLTAQSAE